MPDRNGDSLLEIRPDPAFDRKFRLLGWTLLALAIAASDAVPTHASTMIGTSALSMIRRRFHGLRMPMPEPISDASGMIAQQPMASSSRATIGSSDV